MSRRWIAAAAAAAAVAGLLLWQARTPRVRTARALRQSLVPVVAAAGEVMPAERVAVFPGVIGKVVRVDVAEGAHVAAGTVIADLDGTPYAEQAAVAERDVVSAGADADRAATAARAASEKLERARRLARQKIASADFIAAAGRDLDAARDAAARAASALDAARSRWRIARGALDRIRVLAPSAGVVASLRVRPGQTVSEGAPVAWIENRDALVVSVRVPAASMPLVAGGERARVAVEPLRRTFSGAVRDARDANKTGDSTYQTVMIEVPSPVPDARPGMRVSASIEAAAIPDALTIPAGAVVTRTASGRLETGVFVLEDGRARFRRVRPGAAGSRDVQILSGVGEGETVAAGPASAIARLRDGGAATPLGGE